MLYEHPVSFMTGTRVLLKTSRRKDGGRVRKTVPFISHSDEQFKDLLEFLYCALEEGERIYATACPRCVKRASRIFMQRQLDSQFSDNPLKFYESLEANWSSALSNPLSVSREDKLWMFDCDEDYHEPQVLEELYNREVRVVYSYTTKLGGKHVFVKPFNRENLFSINLLHTNPIMLWAYK